MKNLIIYVIAMLILMVVVEVLDDTSRECVTISSYTVEHDGVEIGTFQEGVVREFFNSDDPRRLARENPQNFHVTTGFLSQFGIWKLDHPSRVAKIFFREQALDLGCKVEIIEE
jgi:hypothetical protein